MVDAGVQGAEDLAHLGSRLKDAGNGELRKELLRGIRNSVKRVIPDVQESARSRLPKGGGLADRVASQKWAARSSLGSSSAKVSLVGSGMKALRDIDRGRLRHPVFGNRDRWVQQQVEPGFFSEPVENAVPKVRNEIADVMADVANRITRSV